MTTPDGGPHPTRELPRPDPAPAPARWWSAVPRRLGRARTSTVVLAVLFVALGLLYLYVRPETTGTTPASDTPSQPVEVVPLPTTSAPPEPTSTAPRPTAAPTTDEDGTEQPAETSPTPEETETTAPTTTAPGTTSARPSAPATTPEPTAEGTAPTT
ncbi:hypothetical protein [Blastococcus sp. SYSU D00820]